MFALCLPMCHEATFTVPKAQAGFAEDLLEATGRLVIIKGRIRGDKSRAWGEQQKGRLPKPSSITEGRAYAAQREIALTGHQSEGEPWIEEGCKAEKAMWSQVNKLAKQARGEQKKK